MKAVFFDVDGTLIEGTNPDFRYMTATVKDAIRKVQTQGDKVFIKLAKNTRDFSHEMNWLE